MEDSIFTRIIKGEIPCHKVYEDARTIAFMDIHPIQPGAVVVVPKVQIDHFFTLPDPDYQALMATVKQVAVRLHGAFPGAARIGVIIEGFELPHAHVKVFPVSNETEMRHIPDAAIDPDHTALAQLADQLRF